MGSYFSIFDNPNIENGILPALGASSSEVEVIPLNIYPYRLSHRLWNICLTVLVVYTAWAIPFEFGFLKEYKAPQKYIEIIISIIFCMDIIFTFRVPYINKTTQLLVDDRKKIFLNYAKSWLLPDVAALFPSWIITFYGIFKFCKLFRLRRVINLFSRMEEHKNYNYFWVRLVKLICVILFALHLSASIFYHISIRYHDPKHTSFGETTENFFEQSLKTRYVTCIYWYITTLTTVGYGDFHPVNTSEMIFCIFYMLLNLILGAYVIGNVTTLVVNDTSRTKSFRDAKQVALSFAQRNKLSFFLQDQMLSHLSLKRKINSKAQQLEKFHSLPKAIRTSILQELFYPLVSKVYLFRGVSSNLLFQLVSKMDIEFFAPNEDVILQNEVPTDFYIVVSGVLHLMVRDKGVDSIVKVARTLDICGETGVIFNKPQYFTVRTDQLSQLLRLNRTTLLNIIQANVEVGSTIINNLLEHLKEHDVPSMYHIFKEITSLVAAGKMDISCSLHFAAEKAYGLLLHSMLQLCLNPNKSDINGRTALHIAASKGNEECVSILLKNGANINVRDFDGNVPLWEAIVGGHHSVMNMLEKDGANLKYGDVDRYIRIANEQRASDLPEILAHFGVDIKGKTTLRATVSRDNVESSHQRGYWKGVAKQELTLHEIELRVYRCVIEEVNESRLPLRQEQELLLKLQKALHVSNEEHLAELRNAHPNENN